MIANPTDHSLSTQRIAHSRIGVALQALRTSSGRHVAETNVQTTCLSNRTREEGSKLAIDAVFEQRLFKKSFHMAATK